MFRFRFCSFCAFLVQRLCGFGLYYWLIFHIFLPLSFFFALSFLSSFQQSPAASVGIKKIMEAYPDHFQKASENILIWKDGTQMVFDDGLQKSRQELLESPDLEDQLAMPYPKGENTPPPKKGEDAGRIRYEPFFRKMYGNTAAEVQQKLAEVVWLPKTLKIKLKVTTVNDIHKKITAISEALDEKPHLKKYLQNPAGTFNWRNISGTNRLSTHSFGMTIDLNVAHSHYWQWDSKSKDENISLVYRNQIPMEIVLIFEKYGFIWGGKWYHYDTMHFEYRPELL